MFRQIIFTLIRTQNTCIHIFVSDAPNFMNAIYVVPFRFRRHESSVLIAIRKDVCNGNGTKSKIIIWRPTQSPSGINLSRWKSITASVQVWSYSFDSQICQILRHQNKCECDFSFNWNFTKKNILWICTRFVWMFHRFGTLTLAHK